ncbi:O-antigen polymerase [Mycolicibacterium stellerae]|uniref:O-antigen polymerase n=1 Tax=Mycolicibacterium stellerae TaxID=2358193 RepID=UPI001F3A36F9|nr:O-antigen polymerase [Mycolicibacterium stellerae]
MVISLVVASASIAPTVLLSDREFRSLWRTPKSITWETLWLFGSGAVAIAFGAMVAIAAIPRYKPPTVEWPGLSGSSVRLLRRSSTVLTTLTLIGYAAFGFAIVRAGLNPFDLTSTYGEGLGIRDIVGTIPGVTTLTQFGIAAVVVSAILLTKAFSRIELYKLLAVVVLASLRAFYFDERLAILELVVPITVVVAASLSVKQGWRRRVLRFMPPVGLVAVIAIFGLFEYSRSWTYFRTHTSESYLDFVLSRFAGYYATALNNGHLVLQHLDWPNRLPYDTIEAFWAAPGIEQADLYVRLGGHAEPYNRGTPSSLYDSMLYQFGSPEFNNQSGYVGPFIDYGVVGGLIYFLVVGLIAGYLYRRFCRGDAFGLMFYPVVFVGLLEMPRYLYWAQGRTTYAWFGLLIVALLVSKSEAKARDGT